MNRRRTFGISLLAILLVAGLYFAGHSSAQGPEKPATLPPGMTGSNPNDPRSKLTPGVFDAGEAAMGIKHLALLPKPDAFLIGTDPSDPRVNKALSVFGITAADAEKIPAANKMGFAGLAVANSDLAFQGNHLFLGNFYGVNIYDIADPAKTKLLTSMICPGGQGDVSVYKNLMFMSVEMQNGRLDCSEAGFPPNPPSADPNADRRPAASKDRFRGVRIFDISDISKPKQVGAVQTCRGSHTHTLVLDPKDKENVYLYVSGTSFVRQSDELAGCTSGPPDKTPDTAQFRIDVIKVPVAAPQNAKIVNSPRIFADDKGKIDSLTNGGSHEAQTGTHTTNQCHDITAYSAIGLAAGACSGNGILLDIRDPANPKRIESVNDTNYDYWHSASFSNDGKKVVFTDEWGGGLGARCREVDPNVWGADAIFNIQGNQLKFASYYKMPAAQTESENCVAHNGSLVPIPGRDVEIQSWYQGGISLWDFTDADHPMELGYFDRGPLDSKVLILGGSWSAYWYNGNIYSSEIARGLDVFELTPTEHLSQNEIDAAKTVQVAELNVQNQQKIEWPRKLVVAKAYLDQLERSKAVAADKLSEMRQAISKAEAEKKSGKLKDYAKWLEKEAATAKYMADASRMRETAAIFKKPVF